MTQISDASVYLLLGALAVGALVGLAALARALYRTRRGPLGPLARLLVCALVPAFAAVAAAPLFVAAARVAFGLLAALLAVSLVLDARHPNEDGRPATARRVAVGAAIMLGACLLTHTPLETWWFERTFDAREHELQARRSSPEHRAQVASELAACAAEDEDGTACFEYGFGYRQDADAETARVFLVAACERGHETACAYAQDP